MNWTSRRAAPRVSAAILVLSLTACSADSEPGEGPLEIPEGAYQGLCYQQTGPVERLIGLTSMTNTDDQPVLLVGVELIGDGDWSLIEAAVLPVVYETEEGSWGWTGARYYPPKDHPKWDMARSPIPGAVVEPGQEVEFAYHVRVAPTAHIDHAEITYEDDAGRAYVEADRLTLDVVHENEDCQLP